MLPPKRQILKARKFIGLAYLTLIGQTYSADRPGKAKIYENINFSLFFYISMKKASRHTVNSTVSVETVKGTVSLGGYMLLKLNQ